MPTVKAGKLIRRENTLYKGKKKWHWLCIISGFRSKLDENCAFWGYYAESSDKKLLGYYAASSGKKFLGYYAASSGNKRLGYYAASSGKKLLGYYAASSDKKLLALRSE